MAIKNNNFNTKQFKNLDIMPQQENLYGLIIAGGKSTRMGVDKASLNYHGQPQQYYLYKMLQSLCSRVFISCNSFQAALIEDQFELVEDLPGYHEKGPMGGLLSAVHYYPGKNFIVIGCDYPLLTKKDLHDFIDSIEIPGEPKTFFNKQADLFEPLLGYYPHDFLQVLKQAGNAGNFSLQQVLKNNNAGKFISSNINAIKSVDTLLDYQATKKMIG